MQARCRFDSFSGSVMQLHKDELLLFIDELHTSLEDYYLESGSTVNLTKILSGLFLTSPNLYFLFCK